MASTDEMIRGLQSWAGAAVDGRIGPETLTKVWEKAGKPYAPKPLPANLQRWKDMDIRPEWKSALAAAVSRITANRKRYEPVSKETGVPWWAIGCIHLMECNLSFSKHLHNGDSLNNWTIRVPRHRPVTGKPPFTWEESAVDALAYDNLTDKAPQDWRDAEKVLDIFERYNGLGYRKMGVPSPYLWSGSDQYDKGKYVEDGVYDKNAVSKQLGIAPILRELKVL